MPLVQESTASPRDSKAVRPEAGERSGSVSPATSADSVPWLALNRLLGLPRARPLLVVLRLAEFGCGKPGPTTVQGVVALCGLVLLWPPSGAAAWACSRPLTAQPAHAVLIPAIGLFSFPAMGCRR